MLVFIAPSGAGKTSIEKKFHELGFKSIKNYTTRKMRDGEVNGREYYFVSNDEFLALEREGYFAEHVCYLNNHYGFAKNDIKDNKIASVVPEGFDQLLKLKDINIISFYFETDENTRYKRMLSRGDREENAKKRIENDRVLFDGVKEKCTFIINASQTIDEMMRDILDKLSIYKKDVVLLTNGGTIHPLAPKMNEINIHDIATALSYNCRYNGHCNTFYSVASHSIAVSKELKRLGYSPRIQLIGLLHDASEAYICDIPRPIKPFLTNYEIIEKNLQDLIYLKFLGSFCTKNEQEIIHKSDIDIYYKECELFINNNDFVGEYTIDINTIKPEAEEPSITKEKFIEQFYRLKNNIIL